MTQKKYLGVEFGSTRVKSVLIDERFQVIATGNYDWENQRREGIWTYDEAEIWKALQKAYGDLDKKYQESFGEPLRELHGIGISGMMHGYMAFDKTGKLLVPFRTWRNTITEKAAEKLSDEFGFNIPQRWTCAHLYQAVLNQEPHVKNLDFVTTLAGYIHWKLTGEKVLGVGEASGVFPIDEKTGSYQEKMIKKMEHLLEKKDARFLLSKLFPKVLPAGKNAGYLTEEGAKLLDPSGNLKAGVPLCPPEGDAGTGMVATNSVETATGNVSAGTSIFAMVVMDHYPKKQHTEIDLVTTPSGKPVAMVHANNCTSDLNAWMGLFQEMFEEMGAKVKTGDLFSVLFKKALSGDADGGGLLTYNYYSGEPITQTAEGRPLMVRLPEARLSLGNFMRTQIYSAFATLKIGMDLLMEEDVPIRTLYGHGGLFKTPGVAQRFLAAALQTPVTLLSFAGEGGAWGIALLAAFAGEKGEEESLEQFLQNRVFHEVPRETCDPLEEDVLGFSQFMERYRNGITIEKEAIDKIKD